MTGRRDLACAVVLAAALSSTARADDAAVAIGGQPAALHVDAAWRELEAPSSEDGPALVMRRDGGGLLAVTVALAPNHDAWRAALRPAYERAVIAGFARVPGVVVRRSGTSLVGAVPCIDLALERDGAPVAVRLLLFRTRTVGIAVEGLDAAAATTVARGLIPTREADVAR